MVSAVPALPHLGVALASDRLRKKGPAKGFALEHPH